MHFLTCINTISWTMYLIIYELLIKCEMIIWWNLTLLVLYNTATETSSMPKHHLFLSVVVITTSVYVGPSYQWIKYWLYQTTSMMEHICFSEGYCDLKVRCLLLKLKHKFECGFWIWTIWWYQITNYGFSQSALAVALTDK